MMRHNIFIVILLMVTEGFCRKNVLFLMVDDLRPQLNAWAGPDFPESVSPPMITPHLDDLAARSILFSRAYTQYDVCNPSRTSLMTSRRPDTTHVYDLESHWRDVGGNFTSIPQYFKDKGYSSIGIGKVYHGPKSSVTQDPISWSEEVYIPGTVWQNNSKSWISVPLDEEELRPLPDKMYTDYALETLDRIAPDALSGEVPFFLAVGYKKPHLPFSCPERFFDLYPIESINFPVNPFVSENIPIFAARNSMEFSNYLDVQATNFTNLINETVDPGLMLELRRAYYACVSFVDELVGQLINKVETLGLSNNTIISFVGDHGFSLGENNQWAKNTNFEQATHVPMMIHIPGVTDEGIRTSAFAELVDLFPTLAEAAGLDIPNLCPENSSDIDICTEGWSQMPVALNTSNGKSAAFHQVMTGIDYDYVGYTVRTDIYRYTEWPKVTRITDGLPEYIIDWEDNYGYELYDHLLDPEEQINCVDDPSYENDRAELHDLLRAGWRAVLPE